MYQPLTREQYEKAVRSGFSPQQIIDMEKRRKAEQSVPTAPPSTEPPQKKGILGFLGKTAKFLNMEKFGQGLSIVGSKAPEEQAKQTAQNTQNVTKLLQLYRDAQDPARKQTLANTLK